jgi:hypothetical protein
LLGDVDSIYRFSQAEAGSGQEGVWLWGCKVLTVPEFEAKLRWLVEKVSWNQDYLDAVLRALELPSAARRSRLKQVHLN